MCALRLHANANFLWQRSQACGLSPETKYSFDKSSQRNTVESEGQYNTKTLEREDAAQQIKSEFLISVENLTLHALSVYVSRVRVSKYVQNFGLVSFMYL